MLKNLHDDWGIARTYATSADVLDAPELRFVCEVGLTWGERKRWIRKAVKRLYLTGDDVIAGRSLLAAAMAAVGAEPSPSDGRAIVDTTGLNGAPIRIVDLFSREPSTIRAVDLDVALNAVGLVIVAFDTYSRLPCPDAHLHFRLPISARDGKKKIDQSLGKIDFSYFADGFTNVQPSLSARYKTLDPAWARVKEARFAAKAK
jgi:hypothetical protein